ncbi:fatty acid desaturase [Litoreibacter albidus]|uniref:fatty acid desaturase n=1 Tax=Litoreibacter albidus TaxID=670155 RepID=UPI00373598F6
MGTATKTKRDDRLTGGRYRTTKRAVEWPTLVLLVATYAVWCVAVFWVATWSLPLAVLITALAIVQHASLQHEALHGHPSRWQWLNALMVRPSLNLLVPYGRFRDTHLNHHRDANLTDPYDDPETNFLSTARWRCVPRWLRPVYRFNNTLAGRMLIGPLLGQWTFMRRDFRLLDANIACSWAAHAVSTVGVMWLVVASSMPVWAYLSAAYVGMSVLKIRTFLEHRAHESHGGRSVIIEDSGPLAFLFLNNNLHIVHHMHPQVAWYDLPRLYQGRKARFLARNGGYWYRSYAGIMARYLFAAKDPVPHPYLRVGEERLDR